MRKDESIIGKIISIIEKMEKQRILLEERIKYSDNLLDDKILEESKKLDLILNSYIKEMNDIC